MKFFALFPTVFLITLLSAACVSPNGAMPRTDLLGDPAAPSAATRTVVIDSGTPHVNVTGGEIIKFVVNDKAFAWNFDSAQDLPPFDLSQIAPPGIVFDHAVLVYVAPNPLYVRHRGPWWSPWSR